MKRSKKAKKHTLELFTLLEKDCKHLSRQAPYQAEVLLKILKETQWRLPNAWEYALEESLELIFKYQIPLRPRSRMAIQQALENYDRPNWNRRGPDVFGSIYEDLLIEYKVSTSDHIEN